MSWEPIQICDYKINLTTAKLMLINTTFSLVLNLHFPPGSISYISNPVMPLALLWSNMGLGDSCSLLRLPSPICQLLGNLKCRYSYVSVGHTCFSSSLASPYISASFRFALQGSPFQGGVFLTCGPEGHNVSEAQG